MYENINYFLVFTINTNLVFNNMCKYQSVIENVALELFLTTVFKIHTIFT